LKDFLAGKLRINKPTHGGQSPRHKCSNPTTGGLGMIRTGDEYRDSIRDDREICVNREKMADVATHP
jgi:hypothetical protein